MNFCILQGIDKYIKQGYTYIFEMIAPLTRVVVNYGDEESLNLITIRRNEDGMEFSETEPCFKSINLVNIKAGEINLDSKFDNKEGYVLRFSDGTRIKLKYKEYLALHKTLSGLSEKYVIECMRDNIPIDNLLKTVPDEYLKFITEVQQNALYAEREINNYINIITQHIKDMCDTRKSMAEVILSPRYNHIPSSMIFNALDGKDNRKYVFNFILHIYDTYKNSNLGNFKFYVKNSLQSRAI